MWFILPFKADPTAGELLDVSTDDYILFKGKKYAPKVS